MFLLRVLPLLLAQVGLSIAAAAQTEPVSRPHETPVWQVRIEPFGFAAAGAEATPLWVDANTGALEEADDATRSAPGAISPDRRHRVVVRHRDGALDLFLVPADLPDADGRPLTDHPGIDRDPSWHADGRRIAYVSQRGKQWQVWVHDLRSGESSRLDTAAADEHAMQAVFSPFGRYLSYVVRPRSTGKGIPAGNLVLRDTESGALRRLLEARAIHEYAWSPDASALAVATGRGIAFVDPETGEVVAERVYREIHFKLYAHAARGLCWRPDSEAVACGIHFLGSREMGTVVFGDHQLFVVPVEGGVAVHPLPEEVGSVRPVRWRRR